MIRKQINMSQKLATIRRPGAAGLPAVLPYIKCVVVGDAAVGKTCLLMSYIDKRFPGDYIPSVFDNYSVDVLLDGNSVHLALWDTAGSEEYDRLRPLSYRKANVFLICYSVFSRPSFEHVKNKWKPELMRHAPHVPILLVGTKQDLRSDPHAVQHAQDSGHLPVSPGEGRLMARRIGAAASVECSAKTGAGLWVVFERAMRNAR